MNHYTTIDQSKHLIDIGLKTETADMSYQDDRPIMKPFDKANSFELDWREHGGSPHRIQPCWSVGALLELMPKILSLKPIIDLEDNTIYYSGTDIIKEGKTLMEAAYNMIVWLLKNGYIEKKGECNGNLRTEKRITRI